jgi:hypothetical protein
MPDIRYVCLSDLHLGEEDSLLTRLQDGDVDPSRPSPAMIGLADCLRRLVKANRDRQKPTLILNGDILELALAHDSQAAMVFQRFVELIQPEGDALFDRLIFIPGNHDHHLWELARETQYANHIRQHLTPGDPLPEPWHATNLFVEKDPDLVISDYLTNLVGQCRNVKHFEIQTAYPNFGLFRNDADRCAIFHHGHFVESTYQLMSTLKNLTFPGRQQPLQVWDIEAENFAWIDFFWSTLGRSGDVGQDMEIIYEKMLDRSQFSRLLDTLVQSIRKRYGLWYAFAAFVLRFFLLRKLTGTERSKADTLLSGSAGTGLRGYIEGPLREQIMLKRATAPVGMTFVFGHTHKPFQQWMNFSGYPRAVSVYNSGGWVVEGEEALPLHGGAVILLDESLRAVSLRMFNERDNPAKYAVQVEAATAGEACPFHQQIKGLVNPSQDPWKAFSDTVAREVNERIDHLRRRVRQ